MVTLIFESHATTLDNEAGLASGHADPELSALGETQARELGERYRGQKLEAIFCSDLRRSYGTAAIAFRDTQEPIFTDTRLREIDYGHYTRHPNSEVKAIVSRYITKPFPNGESYEAGVRRIKEFLSGLLSRYDGKTVLVIGHRVTQYGLEHWINGLALKDIVMAPWQWQPGWRYILSKI